MLINPNAYISICVYIGSEKDLSKENNNNNAFLLCLQGTPVNIIVGSHVWVEDPEIAWIDGQVSKINGKEVEIQGSNGKKVCGISLWFNFISFSFLIHLLVCNFFCLLIVFPLSYSFLVLSRLLQTYQEYIQKIWKLLLVELMT